MTPPSPDEGTRFTVHRFRRGYRVEDVEALLEQVASGIRGEQPVPDIAAARFSPAYGGYDEREVDEFLADLATQLGQRA